MKHCGYIEGYYGKMLSWEQRLSLLKHLKKLNFNTYIYAPKEDPWHRQEWKKPYPGAWRDSFRKFIKSGHRLKINIVPSLAPGLSFDYLNKGDYRTLIKKFKGLCREGALTVALLMDDIDTTLPPGNRKAFSSLGEAHGLLCGKLLKDLRRLNPDISLWFCPTVYTDRFCEGGSPSTSAYLKDLASDIPSDVNVFWTGTDVVSPSITVKNMSYVTGLFKGRVLVWDNFYANDYCQERVFLGPLEKRSREVLKKTTGFFQNPTGLFETDKICLNHFSDWIKTGDNVEAWKSRMKKVGVPDTYFKISRFFSSPFTVIKSGQLTPVKSREYMKALHFLLFDWKSNLQMELYSYFHHLHRDLELHSLKGPQSPDFRLLRKFTAVMSRLIKK